MPQSAVRWLEAVCGTGASVSLDGLTWDEPALAGQVREGRRTVGRSGHLAYLRHLESSAGSGRPEKRGPTGMGGVGRLGGGWSMVTRARAVRPWLVAVADLTVDVSRFAGPRPSPSTGSSR